jgi:hypothetical protein
MKKYIVLILLVVLVTNLKAQEKTSVEKNIFKINILTPGITYELGIGKKTTLNSDLNIAVVYYQNSGLKVFPYIQEQFRYYYNLEKRVGKNKNTANNSANFMAISASYYFESIGELKYLHRYDGITIAPVWGLQRTYKSNLNINLNAGIGYNFSSNSEWKGLTPVVNFTLGWVLGK